MGKTILCFKSYKMLFIYIMKQTKRSIKNDLSECDKEIASTKNYHWKIID